MGYPVVAEVYMLAAHWGLAVAVSTAGSEVVVVTIGQRQRLVLAVLHCSRLVGASQLAYSYAVDWPRCHCCKDSQNNSMLGYSEAMMYAPAHCDSDLLGPGPVVGSLLSSKLWRL